MKKFLSLAFLLASCTWAWAGETVVPFELCGNRNAVLITIEVNGRQRQVILDTGAETTVLTSSAVGATPMEVKIAAFASGPGMRGEAMWRQVDLKLGKNQWFERAVAVMNLTEVSREYNRNIDGLLGQDVLREFKSVTLDFANKQLVLVK